MELGACISVFSVCFWWELPRLDLSKSEYSVDCWL
uniref:Uncharacterized protein n=1 Tax=Rhizophora mucronata TaxID=61149 RepID=A0A2P2NDE1_RHIMU